MIQEALVEISGDIGPDLSLHQVWLTETGRTHVVDDIHPAWTDVIRRLTSLEMWIPVEHLERLPRLEATLTAARRFYEIADAFAKAEDRIAKRQADLLKQRAKAEAAQAEADRARIKLTSQAEGLVSFITRQTKRAEPLDEEGYRRINEETDALRVAVEAAEAQFAGLKAAAETLRVDVAAELARYRQEVYAGLVEGLVRPLVQHTAPEPRL